MKKALLIIAVIVLIILAVGGIFYWKSYQQFMAKDYFSLPGMSDFSKTLAYIENERKKIDV